MRTRSLGIVGVILIILSIAYWQYSEDQYKKEQYRNSLDYQRRLREHENRSTPSFGSSSYGYAVSYCEGNSHSCTCRRFDKDYENYRNCKNCGHPESYHKR